MKLGGILGALLVVLSLAACGGDGGDSTTYTYPSESMEPSISYREEISVDLDAYESAEPALGDVVAFHPPAGADAILGDECKVAHPLTQPCPQPTAELSTQTFIKRIVALPGDELSIREGLPIVNGEAVLAEVIQECSAEELCNMPEPITVPRGHYFVMGDNSGSSSDSRWWGAVPRAGILGRLEE